MKQATMNAKMQPSIITSGLSTFFGKDFYIIRNGCNITVNIF